MTTNDPVTTIRGWALFLTASQGGWNYDWQNGHGQSVCSGHVKIGSRMLAQVEAERALKELIDEEPFVTKAGTEIYSDDVIRDEDRRGPPR